MPMEAGLYEGRKGQRRLKAIEKQTQKIKDEFRSAYEDSPEMNFLSEEIRWEGASRLIFVMAMRNVHFTWNGVRDYGFLRLCVKWIKSRKLDTLNTDSTGAMIKSILPETMCTELGEELSAMEFF
ncbi:MAG: hypothetical protein Q4C25_03265 [Bacillota bacterium]|nr:hypothetical protein [Bacillota bacterium]